MATKSVFGVNSRNCRRICGTALAFCAMFYIVIIAVYPFDNFRIADIGLDVGYFVNTSGCHMMALKPTSAELRWYLRSPLPFKCPNVSLFRAESQRGGNFLVVSVTEQEILDAFKVNNVADIHCEYKQVRRVDDFHNKYLPRKYFRLSEDLLPIKVEDGFKIMRIKCFGIQDKLIYHDVHFFMPPPETPRNRSTTGAKGLSIIILGLDSISHMHYIRSMPLVASFVERQPHVEFYGYTRVGRNSYPNLVPMLLGQSEEEVDAGCYRNASNFDKCNFLWKYFKAANYVTSIAEDSVHGATFINGRWGFQEQPTDFYMRPILMEINSHTMYSIDKMGQVWCSAGRSYAEILYEFFYKLIPHIRKKPHFAYFWQSQGVHDYFNFPQLVDKYYLRMLHYLNRKSILDNTLVIIMSDHGMRYGSYRRTYQGILEESQPLLITLYPKWLEEEYPLAIANLRKNAHSLVTTFDVHATLKDLVDLELLRDSHVKNRTKQLMHLGTRIPRGISLFLPIPDIRNCAMAGIPSAFCQCLTRKEFDVKDAKSKRAARFIVESINNLLQDYKLCSVLKLDELQAAYSLVTGGKKDPFVLMVRVQTHPGKGQFEGTVRFRKNALTMNGDILRVNRYNNQSYCVPNHKVKIYCYCF